MHDFKKNINRYVPYIDDLRIRIYRGVILFCIVSSTGFIFAAQILKQALLFIHINQVTIATSSPFQFADLSVDVGFFFGILLTVPYFIYSFYAFISPALAKNEKKILYRSVPLSLGLFVFGFLYGFYVLYFALQLLADINIGLGIVNIWDVSVFFSQMFMTAALLGLVFEFPLILTLMLKMGLMNVQFLRNKRRISYFIVFFLVSLLPPTDGVSLIVMSLPLVLLYEATILFNKS